MFDSEQIAKRALSRAADIFAEKKRRRRKAIVASVVCVACAAVAATIFTMGRPLTEYLSLEDGQIPLAAFLLPDGNAEPYTETDAETSLLIRIPASGDVAVRADAPEAEMTLHNPADNPCYLSFEIILEDTGESLYASALVAPSLCIRSITWTRTLAKGAYGAVLVIRAYTLEGYMPMHSVSMAFRIVAE